jgi:hypothetical protein
VPFHHALFIQFYEKVIAMLMWLEDGTSSHFFP